MFSRLRRGGLLTGLAVTLTVALSPLASASGTAPAADPVTAPAVEQASFPFGIVSVQFDDGTIGHYKTVRPTLADLGLQGTFYIISQNIGTPGSMSVPQLRRLRDAGHEIGNHTRDHKDLTKLSEAQVRAEFADAQAVLKSRVKVTATTCAYPFGTTNAMVKRVAAEFFRSCRTTVGGQATADNFKAYELPSFNVSPTTPVSDIEFAVDFAVANKTWLNLTYHKVGKGADATSAADFRAAMEYIENSSIHVLTVNDALDAINK